MPTATTTLDRREHQLRETLGVVVRRADPGPRLAEIHSELARLAVARGDTAIAEAHYRQALAQRTRRFGAESVEAAEIAVRLGTLLRATGRVG